jgi:type IV pilus assembly protein PilO
MAIESWDDIKKLPFRQKMLGLVVIGLLLGYLAWSFFIGPVRAERNELAARAETLATKIEAQERVAAKKEQYLREVKALDGQFRQALLKLPLEKEIPRLLLSLAEEGRRAGLEFVVFEPIPRPAAPAPKPAGTARGPAPKPPVEEIEFYETIPINMTISGTYRQTLNFLERMANLPRIVNVDQVIVGERGQAPGKANVLATVSVIKTFMFKPETLDTGEKADAKTK